jgi:hypothetical protein
VDHVYLADRVVLLNADGSLAFAGEPESANLPTTNIVDVTPTEREPFDSMGVLKKDYEKSILTSNDKANERQENSITQPGNFSIWWYYAKSIGAWRIVAAFAIITINVLASNLPSR